MVPYRDIVTKSIDESRNGSLGELLIWVATLMALGLALIVLPIMFRGIKRPSDLGQEPRTVKAIMPGSSMPIMVEANEAFARMERVRYWGAAMLGALVVAVSCFGRTLEMRLRVYGVLLVSALWGVALEFIGVLVLL
ncbi:MAG TPA: hypothetical protein VGQ99_21160 [Tepidisphaeraceae bacterium]|nr:hypothetical protein [Tepidisphaeraceae bacterium]